MANYTSVIASNICDAAGNKLASGTVSFQATDAANQPLNFQVGGGGQVVTTPATAAIVAGAIAGGFQVADSANTIPAGVLYRVTITDNTLNRIVVAYSLVTVTGTSFNLDTYTSTGASVLPPVGGSVNGPLTVVGDLSITGTFNPGALGAVLAKSIEGVHNVDGTFYAQTSAGIQAAHDDSVDGGEIYLPAGIYAITGTITISKSITIRGAGWGTILQVGAGVSNATDVISIAPVGAGTISGFRLQDFQIAPASGTPARYGIRLNGNNGEIIHGLIEHVQIKKLGSFAIEGDGSGNAQGTPVLTTIRDCELFGGLSFPNCGDTVRVINNRITGAGPAVDATFQAGASTFILSGNNITSDGGIHFGGASIAPMIINNEIETFGTFTGSNGAVIDLDGVTGSHATDALINGNSIQVVNGITANGVRINFSNRALIVNNRFARGATTSVDVVVTANAVSTYIGANSWVAGGPFSQMLTDAGTGTIYGPFYNAVNGLWTAGPIFAVTAADGTVGLSASTAICKGQANYAYAWVSGSDATVALDTQISRLGAKQISIDGTTRNLSDGSLVQTGGIDLGTAQHKRIRVNRGTALVAGDFALSAGWGVGATVTAVVGTDQAWTCTVTAAGTPAANPTLTLTFHDGAWTSSLSPITVTKMTGGSGAIVQLTEVPSATTNVITFNGTPVAASTYIISSVALGR